jgi:hypothetical protein
MNDMPPLLRTTGVWDPVRGLQISSMLTDSFRRMYNATAMNIQPEDVIKVLNQAGAKFALMGAHGIGPWMSEPRATRGVDVLVQKSHHNKAVGALREAYPELLQEESIAVTRFLDAADLVAIVEAHSDDIKANVLFSFGEMVRNGGGNEIVKLIEDIRAGRPILSR